MRGSIRFARVGGIDLKIHFTFLIFVIWLGFTYYFFGGRGAAVQGILFILLLFGCVLLHELGHALMARRFGIRTPDITLLPIGGIARLERIPEKPVQELLIAIAGPLVNVVIAGLLLVVLRQRDMLTDWQAFARPQVDMLGKLAMVNVFLVVFNLIPAFPMDGGRILRSLLAMRLDYVRATRIAARVGQGLAVVFGIVGLLYNPLLIFIALFVYLGATQEATMAEVKGISRGVPVSAAMITEMKVIPMGARLEDALEGALRTPQDVFPLVDDNNLPHGIISREEMIQGLRSRGPDTPVVEVMPRQAPAIHPEDDLNEAITKLQQASMPALPVTDAVGKLVGMLTTQGLSELVLIQSAGAKTRKPFWRPAHA